METSREWCQKTLEFVQRLRRDCDIPISEYKTEGSDKVIKCLGIDIEMDHHTLSVSEGKRITTLNHLKEFMKQKEATIKDWKKILESYVTYLKKYCQEGHIHEWAHYTCTVPSKEPCQRFYTDASDIHVGYGCMKGNLGMVLWHLATWLVKAIIHSQTAFSVCSGNEAMGAILWGVSITFYAPLK